jgi:hypothetical protein
VPPVDSVPGSKAPADDAVLRVGDRVRAHLNFSRWIGRHPTAKLVVGTLTRTPDGTVILGLHWPTEDGRGPSDVDRSLTQGS